LAALLLAPLALGQEKRYAPVPPGAVGLPVPEKGYILEEIRDGVYWVSNGGHQSLIVTTGDGVILVDAPLNLGENLLKAVAEVSGEPIKTFIYSHHHRDHTGKAGILPTGVTYIGQEWVAHKLAEVGDPGRPVPTVTFSGRYTLRLGNKRIELSYKGVNHSPGNTFIYLPDQKILMLVDVISPGWVPPLRLSAAEDIAGYIRAFDQVLEYDFDHFVGGHVGRIGTRHDVEEVREYIHDVMANAGDAIKAVSPRDIAKQVGMGNRLLFLKTYFSAIASNCAAATESKWTGRLGAADVWSVDNCSAMQLHLRID
ncbi:MAG: MBL fold metallo-hydrolase, partial [bacterium]